MANSYTTEASAPSDSAKLRQALAALLREVNGVLSGLSDEQYAQSPVGPVKGSIGGHLRHQLDHIQAAIRLGEFSELNYDQRCRGTDVETDRQCAMTRVAELINLLDDPLKASSSPGRQLVLTAAISSDGNAVVVQSTFERELLFLFSHTLHHNALIRVMVELLGGQVPEHFGYAPATLAYRGHQPCAR